MAMGMTFYFFVYDISSKSRVLLLFCWNESKFGVSNENPYLKFDFSTPILLEDLNDPIDSNDF